MAIEEKRTVTPIYLRNHDIHAVVCEYHPDTGEYKEVERNTVADKLRRGSYCNVDGKLYGVFASDAGPIFFRNNKMYQLKQRDFKIEVQGIGTNSEFRKFVFSSNNGVEISIDYPVGPPILDPWADEETVDFFVYLSKAYERDGFYENFTLSSPRSE
ncbi:hypothetical protein OS242_04960 [Tumebacillus sp. DT12]|uniref:DUF1934 domain-containing protein n=1 Tax=Tumebacillus lacus TaxID=2995335 RepID=A0ABT3WZZ8_9BACL|nr:hypothetical protein [Tumebacillus lacus]MCX7569303.1 hypothetical protein [Tumebacillus lacus]